MSKWRPTHLNCLYVIGDIHGQFKQLKLICNRIFPLRKSDGGKDVLVCLGDYIDRGEDSPAVIDFLIKAKKKYKDQLILLSGNHELMLLKAIEPSVSSNDYLMWMQNGGVQSLRQYLLRKGDPKTTGLPVHNPYELPRHRVVDFIPDDHLHFFKTLDKYYETDDYIFVHGGCDPTVPLSAQSPKELAWDRGLFEQVTGKVLNKRHMPWKKTVVTGHNGTSDCPFISEKFMMLDVSYAAKLMIAELNSMEGFIASRNKSRLVKLDLNESVVV